MTNSCEFKAALMMSSTDRFLNRWAHPALENLTNLVPVGP